MASHLVIATQVAEVPLVSEANHLLKRLVDEFHPKFGMGTFGASVYDTAWVAMITRSVNGVHTVMFPESVAYIVSAQSEDGSFQGDGSDFDLICNTMASLLCFTTLRSKGAECGFDFDSRILNATKSLEKKLQTWDVSATERIAFELIIPRMLELLAENGIGFTFPDSHLLMQIRSLKLSKLGNLDKMMRFKSTLLHSLEAFIGLTDFRHLRGWKTAGSMMCSPSSTAAYLMTLASRDPTSNGEEDWDKEAEDFLKSLTGKSGGWVPNCTPTTVFEYSWAICNLFQNGFDRSVLDQVYLSRITERLKEIMKAQHGVSGWAPGAVPDSDDSSKAAVALSLLGAPIDVQQIMDKFEDKTHFRCFEMERNLSLSANCNVLLALIEDVQGVQKYGLQIEKILNLLCGAWWGGRGRLMDKWHRSPYYLQMLVSQALTKYLYRTLHSQRQPLRGEEKPTALSLRIPTLLFQLALYIDSSQNSDGSWGISGGREETSYAIIALANLASHDFTFVFRPRISSTIMKGRDFLLRIGATERWEVRGHDGDYVWIGKIGYAVETVCKSYVLGAMNVPVPTVRFGYDLGRDQEEEKLLGRDMENIDRSVSFFARLPVFKGVAKETLKIWMVESFLFLRELKTHRFKIFDRKGMQDDAKYLGLIPFSWTGADRLVGSELSNEVLFGMTLISMFNFQADEYIDGFCVLDRSIRNVIQGEDLGGVMKGIVDRIFAEIDSQESENQTVNRKGFSVNDGPILSTSKSSTGGTIFSTMTKEQHNEFCNENKPSTLLDPHNLSFNSEADLEPQNQAVFTTLRRFVTFILSYPHIQRSSTRDRAFLKRELHSYLVAHVGQCEDNLRFQAQPEETKTEYISPPSYYVKWVRTSGAETTSSIFSFAFFLCLLGHEANTNSPSEEGIRKEKAEDVFQTPMERYLAEAVLMHNGAAVRLWNDYGSVARDQREGNVSSVLFPEFASTPVRAMDTAAMRGGTTNGGDPDAVSTIHGAGAETQTPNLGVAKELGQEQAAMRSIDVERRKEDLASMAQHEDACLKIALSELERVYCSNRKETPGKWTKGAHVIKAVNLFCTTSRVYNEMYALRDVSAEHV